jgi:adenylosuccinate lyase
VQKAAAAAWDEGTDFRGVLGSNPEVQRLLTPEDLNAVFDPARFLQNLGGAFAKLEKLPVEGA